MIFTESVFLEASRGECPTQPQATGGGDLVTASVGQPTSSKRLAAVFGISILLILVTRLPLMPGHLYSFDTVNLALALDDFDPTRNQPQPPGYPLFVLEARLVHLLAGTPEHTFAVLGIVICGLAVGMLFLRGKRLFSPWVGGIAAALLLVNPPFWFSGLTSPLRPHLALFSVVLAYCCWRVLEGERWYFYLASLALGLGGGFRPELALVLLPWWACAGWRGGRARLLLSGALVFVGATLVWTTVLVIESGGLARVLSTFGDYLHTQTYQTSPLMEAPSAGWRRMAGRAVVWTGLGALAWFWTLPFGWLSRRQWPDWSLRLQFLALWFFPGFLLNLLVHVADPDHALATIPAVCLLGGVSLLAAEQHFQFRWIPFLKERGFAIWITFCLSYFLLFLAQEPRQKWLVLWLALVLALLFLFPSSVLSRSSNEESNKHGPLVCLALLGNIFLFFGEFSLPQRTPVAHFRGWDSVADAFLVGTYETSYERVYWVSQMTDLALLDIAAMKANKDRPLIVVWSRNGTPVWRKVCFYHPSEKVYALDEEGDPGVPATLARLWMGAKRLARYSGEAPIRLPLPKGARIIWLLGGERVQDLARVVPLRKAQALYYTDLAPDASGFRWGSFEFVPH